MTVRACTVFLVCLGVLLALCPEDVAARRKGGFRAKSSKKVMRQGKRVGGRCSDELAVLGRVADAEAAIVQVKGGAVSVTCPEGGPIVVRAKCTRGALRYSPRPAEMELIGDFKFRVPKIRCV